MEYELWERWDRSDCDKSRGRAMVTLRYILARALMTRPPGVDNSALFVVSTLVFSKALPLFRDMNIPHIRNPQEDAFLQNLQNFASMAYSSVRESMELDGAEWMEEWFG